MAINDAVAAYTGQQNAAAAEYKDAWAGAPSAGVGQFGSQGPFSGASAGLSSTPGADVSALKTAAAQAVQPPSVLSGANIDALPTTPTGATSADPIKEAIETTSNFSSKSPYVADVTDAGDVGRQEARPERLAIDDTMSQDEQYRRAWQNEANGYYGTEVAKVAVAPAVAPEASDSTAAPTAPIEYGVSYEGQTDSSDGAATIYDKTTGQVVQRFNGMNLHQRMGGVGSINSDQLKEYTGWSAPTTPAAPAAPEAMPAMNKGVSS